MPDHDQNKDLVRRYFAALNSRDFDGAVALATTDLVNHAAIPEAQGSEGMRRILTKLTSAMPDLTFECQDLIAEADKVVCRLLVRGTQTGPIEMTRFRLPATGRETSTEHIHIFRIEGGKLAEHWAGRDDFLMMRQLGHSLFAGEVRS
jgi:steroid delta-isomerase-like uncharacterized protein